MAKPLKHKTKKGRFVVERVSLLGQETMQENSSIYQTLRHVNTVEQLLKKSIEKLSVPKIVVQSIRGNIIELRKERVEQEGGEDNMIETRVCDICGELVVGEFANVIIKHLDKPIIYNGHKGCIESKARELGVVDRRAGEKVLESAFSNSQKKNNSKSVSISELEDQECKIPSENAPKLTGNYPPKPNIDRRVLDDWYENEFGWMCRVLSPHVEDKYK